MLRYLLSTILLVAYTSASVLIPKEKPSISPCYNTNQQEAAKKVDVELYYESLCPGCFDFITSALVPAINNMGYIMNVTFLPFGNAQETKSGGKYVYFCQHGYQECQGNLVEVCLIHYHPNVTFHSEFIDCFEKDFMGHQPPKWSDSLKVCAKSQQIDVEKISKCVQGDLGNQLQHEVAKQTGAHAYVPWVIINGVHKSGYEDNAVKVICNEYTGPKPKYCQQVL